MNRILRWLTLHRLVIILTFVGVFIMAFRAPLDTDMLWHLRAGQWQVENRALLNVDVFSSSRAGEAWINHSWLSQIVLYGSYAALGDAGLALYTALLAAAGMAFLYPQMEGNALIRAFVLVLAAAAAAVFWSPRPQMVSFFLSAVVLYLLWRYQRQGHDRLWLIPPLMALWANLHGGFAIGFILMVLATVGQGLRWLFEDVIERRQVEAAAADTWAGLRPVGRLIIVGLVGAAAVSLNPYGPRMLLYPFRTVGIGVLQDFIQEWAAPDFHQPNTWPFLWLLLGTLIAVGLSRRRLDWRDVALLAGTAYSALLAGRNIATFALVAAPVLSCHLADWLAGLGLRLNLTRPPRGALVALNWALLLIVLAGGAVKIGQALDPRTLEAARAEALPVRAVAYLEAARPPGPLFNSYNWGGYLIWTARDYPVYVDGRTDLYDDDLLRDYLGTVFALPGWEERLDAAGANTVLIETRSPLARLLDLSAGWRQAYADDLASVYVREVPLGE